MPNKPVQHAFNADTEKSEFVSAMPKSLGFRSFLGVAKTESSFRQMVAKRLFAFLFIAPKNFVSLPLLYGMNRTGIAGGSNS